MQGEVWLVVRLTMEAKPNTLTSSCRGGRDAAAAVELLLGFWDDGFFFFAASGVAVASLPFGSISVESTVPTISFSIIKSANCDECGAWTLCLCIRVFIPWKNRSFMSQKRNSTWTISGSLDFFFGLDFSFLFLLLVLFVVTLLPLDVAVSVFWLAFFALLFIGSSYSSSSELISSSSLSLASGFRINTPSKTRESSSDDEESSESLPLWVSPSFCCSFCSSSMSWDAEAPSLLAVAALFDFRFLAIVFCLLSFVLCCRRVLPPRFARF
mmetsp:Transcript_24186/g.50681  ORF Transcript_24186/g.50681 Transcript_24186/m.50681 type:complete len:269 (-) Transcript_24186:28-834(-)